MPDAKKKLSFRLCNDVQWLACPCVFRHGLFAFALVLFRRLLKHIRYLGFITLSSVDAGSNEDEAFLLLMPLFVDVAAACCLVSQFVVAYCLCVCHLLMVSDGCGCSWLGVVGCYLLLLSWL